MPELRRAGRKDQKKGKRKGKGNPNGNPKATGRKPLPPDQKKTLRIQLYFSPIEVKKKGGKKRVAQLLTGYFALIEDFL